MEGSSVDWWEWGWFRAAEGQALAGALSLPWESFPGDQGRKGALGLLCLLAASYKPWDAFALPCPGMQSC